MADVVREFNEFRSQMNEKILSQDNLVIKRFFNLDTNVYKDGALSAKVKDMLGLVASLGLNPQKSRVLLRVALTKTRDVKEIQRYFDEY